MSLYHLVYESQAIVPFEPAELMALLKKSRAYNQQAHITGLLLHSPEGRFFQILEGEAAEVRKLYYQRILADTRHYQCRVLGEGSCAERSFADWSMGLRVAQASDLDDLLQTGSLNAPTPLGPRPTIRPELLELLLNFVETEANR